MQYLSAMENDQTLVMYSGHPMGVFPSNHDAPRVVVTNGMVIPNYSGQSITLLIKLRPLFKMAPNIAM